MPSDFALLVIAISFCFDIADFVKSCLQCLQVISLRIVTAFEFEKLLFIIEELLPFIFKNNTVFIFSHNFPLSDFCFLCGFHCAFKICQLFLKHFYHFFILVISIFLFLELFVKRPNL